MGESQSRHFVCLRPTSYDVRVVIQCSVYWLLAIGYCIVHRTTMGNYMSYIFVRYDGDVTSLVFVSKSSKRTLAVERCSAL